MCRNGQGALASLAPSFARCVHEIGLSWLLEGSSFDPACLVVTVTTSSEVYWTGLSLLDT